MNAFDRDFKVNGPYIVRVVRTMLQGWRRYKDHPDRRIRRRFEREARDLPVTYAAALWATRRWFRSDPILEPKITRILKNVYREFGLKSRLAVPLAGRYVHFRLRQEDKRLRQGRTYEPPTFYEMTNQPA